MSLENSKMSNSALEQAQNVARQLRKKMLEDAHGVEIARLIMKEESDVVGFVQVPATKDRANGPCVCQKCKARLENPHAEYHLTPFIDPSKF